MFKSMREAREAYAMSQSELARRMVGSGFATWTQMTVSRREENEKTLRWEEGIALRQIIGYPEVGAEINPDAHRRALLILAKIRALVAVASWSDINEPREVFGFSGASAASMDAAVAGYTKKLGGGTGGSMTFLNMDGRVQIRDGAGNRVDVDNPEIVRAIDAYVLERMSIAWLGGVNAQWKHRPIGNRIPEIENPYGVAS